MASLWLDPTVCRFYAVICEHLHQLGVTMDVGGTTQRPLGACYEEGSRLMYRFHIGDILYHWKLILETGERKLMVASFVKDYAAEVSTVRSFHANPPDVNGGEGGGIQVLIPISIERDILTELRPATHEEHQIRISPYDFVNDNGRVLYRERNV